MLPILLFCTLAAGQNPLTNPGFEQGANDQLPGWERIPWGQPATVDATVSHSGQRSLRVTGHGGYHTTLVPYPGGRVRISGWLKTLDVVRGTPSYHRAALQLISYDAERKSLGHLDIALVDGTHDWTFHERAALLSREVKFVAVHCHFWGGEVRGTAWFDDVSLEFLDPALTARPPLELTKATVTVDPGRDLGEFRHLWLGSDVGWMDRVESKTQLDAMTEAHKAGFRYIRMHGCLYGPRIYSEDEQGRPQYDWTIFDCRIQLVVDHGMRPVIVLETMPVELAGRDSGRGWTNHYPPKDDQAYAKWQEYIRQTVAHCRVKWGESIHDWYFEVWNEPDSSGYFEGTLEQYLQIYDHAVAGAVEADPDIRIGGPGGAGNKWVEAFLQHCAGGQNHASGRNGARVDFLSWHIYTVGVGVPSFDALRLSLAGTKQAVAKFEVYRELPLLITEWGCSSSRFAGHDRPYDAAYRTMAVREFLDAGITLALPFCLGDGPQHAHEGFQGGLALFTKTTIPKPSFRAFELLGRMTGRRVACGSSNDPVGGLAALAADGTLRVMLYNLVENSRHEPYQTAVTVKLPPGSWTCRSTRIATGECDPFVAWEAMGQPEKLTPAQRLELLQRSQLPAAESLDVGADGTLRLGLPGSAVALLELSR